MSLPTLTIPISLLFASTMMAITHIIVIAHIISVFAPDRWKSYSLALAEIEILPAIR